MGKRKGENGKLYLCFLFVRGNLMVDYLYGLNGCGLVIGMAGDGRT